MTATVRFTESNGVGQTVTTALTGGMWGNVDLPNLVPAEHPVTIPSAGGPNFSYEKWWRIQLATLVAPTTKVDNFRFWRLNGLNQTGETMRFNLVPGVRDPDAYATPVNAGSTKATEVIPDHPMTEPAKNLYTGIGESLDELNAVNQFSDYIVLQVAIAVGAPTGPVPGKVFRLHYDEQ